MSIEERRNEVIEFRKKGSLGAPIISAVPGQVSITLHTVRNVAELDEFIDALRRAAKAANLPDGPGEAKTA